MDELKPYIGTKIIAAQPMDERTFSKNHKGVGVTGHETREGYLVKYPDGYISWSKCLRQHTEK